MTPERWQEVERIYHAVLAHRDEERARFLAEACGGDAALVHEVESLLAQAGAASAFLETPAHAAGAAGQAAGRSLVGRRLGPYAIQSVLGVGGMGEVYRAHDTTLGRDVAIKVLPEEWLANPERRARFEREARILASLNHPHIGAIYGVEQIAPTTGSGQAGTRALVLELVEGQTLEEKLADGSRLKSRGSGLPPSDALSIARQIAEALEAAHEKGIVHRDLKPANIKITPDGIVKVLDFGLAKPGARGAGEAGGPGGEHRSNSPTLTLGGTREGVILGTPAYMSPEQARGQVVDKRTDIWAFGCVLYEMLAGRAAFGGETVADTLAAIVDREPDWTALPETTPASVRKLLRRCLEKDASRRLHDIADGRIEIDECLASTSTASGALVPPALATGRPARSTYAGWLVAAAATLAAITVATFALRRGAPESPPIRLDVTTPPSTDPGRVSLAISPDGQKIVFVAASEGRPRLWLRSLDSGAARPLAGTDFASYPFWSPDSRSVGIFTDDKLKLIDVESGSTRTLADVAIGMGGTWNREGVILFSQAPNYRVFRVAATGGEAVALTQLNAQPGIHRFPHFLPDGRHFLYYRFASPETTGVYMSSLDGVEPRRLLGADSAATYAPSGHLLFARQGKLLAQKFDPDRLLLTGDPFSVVDQVAVGLREGAVALSASAAGPIAYRSGQTSQERLEWFDRSGKAIENVPFVGASPALSPDGRLLAVQKIVNGNMDIWLIETAGGRVTRFTSDPADDVHPTWSPDGSRIVFASKRKSTFDLYEKSVDGALGSEKVLLETPQDELVPDWSSDGRNLLYRRHVVSKLSQDIWARPFGGDQKPFMVVGTDFDERDGRFSPDGKWIAYQSNESGRYEIYVRPFPGSERQFKISTDGGVQVHWRGNGKELYYLALDNRLMAVPIQLSANGQAVDAGAPVPLFATRVIGGPVQPNPQYTVSRDGQRFLMHTATDEATLPITVILNWKARP